MSNPYFSKHLRIKVHKTPLLDELLSYSRKANKPKQFHIDNLVSVWRNFPISEQCNYKHITDMSIDLSSYITKNNSNPNSPTPLTRKGMRQMIRSNSSSNIKKSPSSLIMSSPYANKHTKETFSPATKNIAINLNKHKLEEPSSGIQFLQEMHNDNNPDHKKQCDCNITEIQYHQYVEFPISDFRLFISCRYSANDFPELIKNRIYAILSIGENPKHFPAIKGGYYNILYDGLSLLKPLQVTTRFLNAKLKLGNVLVHCDTGNNQSCILIMAYLLKELKLAYQCVFMLIKDARPHFTLTSKEELYLKCYEHKKNTQSS